MKLKTLFVIFTAIMLLAGGLALAQKKKRNKHKNYPGWPKIVWRQFELNSSSGNYALLSLYDSVKNRTNFNQIISDALTNHEINAYRDFDNNDATKVNDSTLQSLGRKNDSGALLIQKYFLVEEWAFYTDSTQITATIKWIGACDVENKDTASAIYPTECEYCPKGSLKPIFGLQYSGLIPIIKKYKIKEPGKENSFISCYDFFANRLFSSKIIGIVEPK